MVLNLILPVVIAVISFLFFAGQTCPTFYFWDSAELTAAILNSGIPHASGFPFFLLAAKIWLGILPDNPAHSLNLFSAFFAALGLAVWFAVIQTVIKRSEIVKGALLISLSALVGTIIMAISLTYSIQATRLEVYSFNFFGFALMTYFALKISESANYPYWWLGALTVIIGLFLGVHTLTIALAIPGILLFPIIRKRLKFKWVTAVALGALLIVVLLYSSIMVMASHNPILNWGNPSNPGRLIDYITASDFSKNFKWLSLDHISANFSFVLDLMSKQIGLVSLLLSIWGIFYLAFRKVSIGLPLLIIMILNFFSIIMAENYFYENYDLHGYLMISLAILAVGLATSMMLIYSYVSSRLSILQVRFSNIILIILLVAGSYAILYQPLNDNLYCGDLSKTNEAKVFAAGFLENAPDSSLIVTSSYNTYFTLLAYQSLYGNNKNQKVLNLYNWDHKWGREATDNLLKMTSAINLDRQAYYRGFLNQYMNQRPIYVEYDQSSGAAARYLRPDGPGYIFSASDTSNISVEDSWRDINSHLLTATSSNDIENIRTWINWFQNRGEFYRRKGNETLALHYFGLIEPLAMLAVLK